MKFLRMMLLACAIVSCHSGVKKSAKLQPAKTTNKSAGHPKQKKTRPVQHKLMEFVEYNDEGDYFLLVASKSDSLFSFINDQSNDRSLLRGDLIDLSWQTTVIEIAGDGGRREQAEKVISIVKIKDGNVSKFRQHYRKKLKYTWPQEDNYSAYYLDKLYQLVEYYIANSKNELLRLSVENREQLSYSIEKQIRNQKEYLLVGISSISAQHLNTIQWLYLDKEDLMIYQYDLPGDTLVRFD